MSHIVVLGAGLGGLPAAYELRALLDLLFLTCSAFTFWMMV